LQIFFERPLQDNAIIENDDYDPLFSMQQISGAGFSASSIIIVSILPSGPSLQARRLFSKIYRMI